MERQQVRAIIFGVLPIFSSPHPLANAQVANKRQSLARKCEQQLINMDARFVRVGVCAHARQDR